jgi:hypothetical protein
VIESFLQYVNDLVALEFSIVAGRSYAIIPSTFDPQILMHYYINVYSKYPVTMALLTEEKQASAVEVCLELQFNHIFIFETFTF